MAASNAVERLMYIAPPQERCDPYRNSWKRVSESTGGVPMRFTRLAQAASGDRHAMYVAADHQKFFRAAPVYESDHAKWATESPRFVARLKDMPCLLLELEKQITPDHLVCFVLTEPGWFGIPDVLVDGWAWGYATDVYGSAIVGEKLNGRRAFLSRDGLTLWEIEEVLAPLAKGYPLRIEMVRRRPLSVSGLGSVLEQQGLDFILDAGVRRQLEEKVRRLEHEFMGAMSPRVVHDCAVAAEGLLLEIGKQRVRGGLRFGKFSSPEEVEKLLGQHLKPLLDSFIESFESTSAKDELKWLPGAILAIRAWGEEERHLGKDQRQLLDADGFTAAFCYGALRDFIRLCHHMWKADPKSLCPPIKSNEA